jgi:glycosyltransferase involved in cell wall biosynthesis
MQMFCTFEVQTNRVKTLKYTLIVPVYNRPNEIDELLESLTHQDFQKDYEILIVEDGSKETSEEVIKKYKDQLNITYFFKENSGPGDSRNFGMRHAKGNYFIILDSDVILPPLYLSAIDAYLQEHYLDCFGGADAAHESFSTLQKAINYVMTSFLTTGGIRGNKKSIQKFEPRSFNMGISKEAFEATQGFSRVHPGEDPDLSQRIVKAGFTTGFLPGAHVFHKRRISWKKFYIQVKKFGTARPFLSKWHPSTEKITFWFPTLFVFFTLASIASAVFVHYLTIVPLAAYVGIIFLDSTIKNKNLLVGILTVVALFIQFFGYGLAFLKSTFYIKFLGRDPETQFPKMFFKA